MKVEDLQSYITLFRDWLNERAAPLLHGENPSLVLAWRDELATAERLLDEKPELPIALLGPSQQGKSSLINAIVGENILPVAVPQWAPEHLSASGLAQAGHPGLLAPLIPASWYSWTMSQPLRLAIWRSSRSWFSIVCLSVDTRT